MQYKDFPSQLYEAIMGAKLTLRHHTTAGDIIEAKQIGAFLSPVLLINKEAVSAEEFKDAILKMVESKTVLKTEFGITNQYDVFEPFEENQFSSSPIPTHPKAIQEQVS